MKNQSLIRYLFLQLTSSVNLSLALLVTTTALVVFFAFPAYAQAEQLTNGADKLLEKGVLGILCVIEAIMIFLLFREIRILHTNMIAIQQQAITTAAEWAIKATTVLTRVNDHMDKQDRHTTKQDEALDKLTKLVEKVDDHLDIERARERSGAVVRPAAG